MDLGVPRRVLIGVLVAFGVGGAAGCVFDPSGRPPDDQNVNNATNSNNANFNANLNTNTGNNNTAGPVCGDEIIESGEGCDDGNVVGGDGCGSDCAVESGWDCSSPPCVSVCGDGLVVGAEACDDGIIADGDGCASDCTVESFHACAGEPSLCHCVVYVDQAGVSEPRTGGTWTAALATVQQGISAASAACEVWVAAGVYHIWQGSDNDAVSLRSDVAVYGGFAGGESQLDQRNWLLHETVLDGANSAETERVFHVVTADAVQGATLDGFTVTRGNAKWGHHGGGLHIQYSAVTLRRLRVVGNTADINGGGVHCWDSTVTLARSLIQGNDANDGGGVNADHNTQLTVDRCRFLANQADYHGGGLRLFDNASATITNSLFVDNQVVYNYGGAIVNWSATTLTLTNCTLYRNHAALSAGAVRNLAAAGCTVRNSIIWGNTPNAFDDVSTTVTLSHTLMQDGGWAGANGNLGVDPLLLLGYDLAAASPAIDTADDAYAPTAGLGGNSRVDIGGIGTPGTLADMGCFEYSP